MLWVPLVQLGEEIAIERVRASLRHVPEVFGLAQVEQPHSLRARPLLVIDHEGPRGRGVEREDVVPVGPDLMQEHVEE